MKANDPNEIPNLELHYFYTGYFGRKDMYFGPGLLLVILLVVVLVLVLR